MSVVAGIRPGRPGEMVLSDTLYFQVAGALGRSLTEKKKTQIREIIEGTDGLTLANGRVSAAEHFGWLLTAGQIDDQSEE